ncbi:c-type cytochrome [Sedimenticola hydrogenitrophicus]|uniref:c-type cytochrome n=1 Tax=Sedimenticola hydrogenitrophicus TaxID=2967975 RepID=UPI0021A39252|nr:cytochrome c [Sedimenticola hydrogenitrophicus]
MNKRLMQTALITCLLASGAASTSGMAQESTQAAIDFRASVMTTFKWYVQPMGAMAKGKIPFDAARFKSRAEGLANATRLDVSEGFPEGSIEESDAKPEIWDNWDEFLSNYRNLQDEADKLQQVAATGDEKAMLAQFKKTAETCGGCHKKFRQKKES